MLLSLGPDQEASLPYTEQLPRDFPPRERVTAIRRGALDERARPVAAGAQRILPERQEVVRASLKREAPAVAAPADACSAHAYGGRRSRPLLAAVEA